MRGANGQRLHTLEFDVDNTWEDVGRLLEDVPYRVRNYLVENAAGHPPL